MGERESRGAAAAQLGLVLVVLCVGLAGGSLLARKPAMSAPRGVTVAASVPVGRAPIRTEGELPALPATPEVSPNEPIPAGTAYAPVTGAVPFGEVIGPGDEEGRGTIPDAPSTSVSQEREVPAQRGDSVTGIDSIATSAALPRRQDQDDVASVSPDRASAALLFAVSSGHETVLFDVGVVGAGALPPSIRGAWAWVGTCSDVTVEISQLPGAPAGSVRGLGSGTPGERFGWVVPRSGCRSASRRIRPSGQPPRPSDVDAPREVQELRSLGELPCASGHACAWFAGLDGRGRAVALLVRGSGNRWISLGPGAGARP